MGSVTFHHVFKRFNTEVKPSVNDFHLTIADGEFLVMVGPSGCGKSTTLRMLAGLEEVTDGEIYIDDRLMNYVSPKNRDLAMVFQNYALYPNLSVYENIALGLKLRKVAKHEVELKVNRAARVLDIAHLLDRRPSQLSGGQKQRVALGRAIVREPKVFLMDEPLSNLDAQLRAQTRAELIRMHGSMKTTIVYVTHDQVEAMTMGTRIVVMKAGEIQQVAPPQHIYDHPANRFVAGFIGTPQMNFVDGRITQDQGALYFETNRWKLKLPDHYSPMLSQTTAHHLRNVVLGLRPEHIVLEHDRQIEQEDWMVSAQVDMKELMGSDTYVSVDTGNGILTLRADAHTLVQRGDRLRVQMRMDKAHFFAKDGGMAILRKGDD